MKYLLITMRDEMAGFLEPKAEANEDTAKRNFEYAIKNTPFLYSNATDYSLFAIGTYDTESGIIESFKAPKFLMRGASPESPSDN